MEIPPRSLIQEVDNSQCIFHRLTQFWQIMMTIQIKSKILIKIILYSYSAFTNPKEVLWYCRLLHFFILYSFFWLPLSLVNCPTRWSLLLIFGFLFWSSSWRWQPHIGVCRLLWSLLRAGMVVLTHFFCKVYFSYVSRSCKKKLDSFFFSFTPWESCFL